MGDGDYLIVECFKLFVYSDVLKVQSTSSEIFIKCKKMAFALDSLIQLLGQGTIIFCEYFLPFPANSNSYSLKCSYQNCLKGPPLDLGLPRLALDAQRAAHSGSQPSAARTGKL